MDTSRIRLADLAFHLSLASPVCSPGLLPHTLCSPRGPQTDVHPQWQFAAPAKSPRLSSASHTTQRANRPGRMSATDAETSRYSPPLATPPYSKNCTSKTLRACLHESTCSEAQPCMPRACESASAARRGYRARQVRCVAVASQLQLSTFFFSWPIVYVVGARPDLHPTAIRCVQPRFPVASC